MLYVFALGLLAQEPVFEWGEEAKSDITKGLLSKSRLIGFGKSGYYEMEYAGSRTRILIRAFDDHCNKVQVGKEQELLYFDDTYKYFGSVTLNGQIYVFSYGNIGDDKGRFLCVDKVNMETLDLMFEPQIISKIFKEKITGKSHFHIRYSQDWSKVLVLTVRTQQKNPFADSDDSIIGITVLNDNMEIQWQQDSIDLGENVLSQYFDDCKIGNDGNVYLLNKAFKVKSPYANVKDGEAIFYYKFFCWRNDGKTRSSVDFDLPGEFIRRIQFDLASNQHPFFVGMTNRDKRIKNSSDGFFAFQIDPEKMNIDALTHQKILGKLQEAFLRTDRKIRLRNWFIKNAEYLDDGGRILVLEKEIILPGDDPRYTSDAVIVFKLSKENKISWVHYIPKDQFTRSTSSVNYSIFSDWIKDKLIIVYNDHEANFNIKPNEKPTRFLGGNRIAEGILISIDADGNLSKQRLYDASETKNQVDIWDVIWTNTGTFIFDGSVNFGHGKLTIP